MPKGKGNTPETNRRIVEAGANNLARWQASKQFRPPHMTHGAGSTTIRKRYSDLRTSEGQKLKAIVDALVTDLGGVSALNSAQEILLAQLRGKLIVQLQISDYLDRQKEIIKNGEILPVLNVTYLKYSDSVRRDLETLFSLARGQKKKRIPSLEDLLSDKEGTKEPS